MIISLALKQLPLDRAEFLKIDKQKQISMIFINNKPLTYLILEKTFSMAALIKVLYAIKDHDNQKIVLAPWNHKWQARAIKFFLKRSFNSKTLFYQIVKDALIILDEGMIPVSLSERAKAAPFLVDLNT